MSSPERPDEDDRSMEVVFWASVVGFVVASLGLIASGSFVPRGIILCVVWVPAALAVVHLKRRSRRRRSSG